MRLGMCPHCGAELPLEPGRVGRLPRHRRPGELGYCQGSLTLPLHRRRKPTAQQGDRGHCATCDRILMLAGAGLVVFHKHAGGWCAGGGQPPSRRVEAAPTPVPSEQSSAAPAWAGAVAAELVPKKRGLCSKCGRHVSMAQGGVQAHKSAGQWCEGGGEPPEGILVACPECGTGAWLARGRLDEHQGRQGPCPTRRVLPALLASGQRRHAYSAEEYARLRRGVGVCSVCDAYVEVENGVVIHHRRGQGSCAGGGKLPARRHRSGQGHHSVRTVSGGLPSLGRRH